MKNRELRKVFAIRFQMLHNVCQYRVDLIKLTHKKLRIENLELRKKAENYEKHGRQN